MPVCIVLATHAESKNCVRHTVMVWINFVSFNIRLLCILAARHTQKLFGRFYVRIILFLPLVLCWAPSPLLVYLFNAASATNSCPPPPQPFSFSYPHRQGEMRLAVSTAAAAVCCCCCCCWLLHTLFYIIWVCWADGRLTTARGICVMPHDDNKCVCLYCILYTYYGTSTATKTKWCEASWTKANKEKKNISKLCSTCCPNALP